MRAFARKHPLVLYFTLAYAFSWAWWIPMVVNDADVRPGGATHLPGLLGPMLAALVVVALRNGYAGVRELAARMTRWRVRARWYLAAFSPFAFFALAAVGLAIAGEGWRDLSGFGRFDGAPLWGPLGVYALILFVNSFGEETGWRGFALPQLQLSNSPLRAALVVAAFWATWHVPMFFVLPNYTNLGGALPAFIVGVFAASIVFTRLYNAAGGLIAVLFHANFNYVAVTEAGQGVVASIASAFVIFWGVSLAIDEVRANRFGHRGPLSGRRAGPPDSVNALVKGILRSPLHGMLSKSLVLMTVHGRKTGREISFPAQYAETDGVLYLVPGGAGAKRWWRNLTGGAPVVVRIRGVDYRASAEAIVGTTHPRTVATALDEWLSRFPAVAKKWGIDGEPHRWDDADLLRVAEAAVVVRVTPRLRLVHGAKAA